VYFLYPVFLFIIRLFSHSKRKVNDDSCTFPQLSVIVPTYNEVNVINSKLTDLLNMSYPKDRYEIIVVDSASSDGTSEIVRKFEKEGVILLQQEERMGKSSAINFALEKARGEIVVLSDANSKFEVDAFNMLIRKFDSGVGGVQPRICPCRDNNLWDRFFLWLHHVYKTQESNVDSVFFASGKLFAFRKTSFTKIDENSAADDLEIALNMRRRNLRVKYAPDVKVVEKAPITPKEVRIQRVRRAFGVLQVIWKNKTMLFNPKYSAYGFVIFPTHFLQITLQPFLIFYLLTIVFMKILLTIPSMDTINLFFVVALICIVFFSLLLIKKMRRVCSVGYNFLLTQAYIVLAIFDFMRGKSYRIWKKVSSTRDALS